MSEDSLDVIGNQYPGGALYGLFAYQDPTGPALDLYRETGFDGVLVVVDGAQVRIPPMAMADLRDALTTTIQADADASRAGGVR